MSTEGMDTHLAQIGAFLEARGIGEDMSDQDIVTAVTYGFDRAREIIASLQAEIAALRGALPEGWEREDADEWLCGFEACGTQHAMKVHDRDGHYSWCVRTDDLPVDSVLKSGTAPTLLEAIAACEAARGAQ
jgi:hypothetical protein